MKPTQNKESPTAETTAKTQIQAVLTVFVLTAAESVAVHVKNVRRSKVESVSYGYVSSDWWLVTGGSGFGPKIVLF